MVVHVTRSDLLATYPNSDARVAAWCTDPRYGADVGHGMKRGWRAAVADPHDSRSRRDPLLSRAPRWGACCGARHREGRGYRSAED